MNSYPESTMPAELATLAGQSNERWAAFLQILQASELSYLANNLDNDLVTFTKQELD